MLREQLVGTGSAYASPYGVQCRRHGFVGMALRGSEMERRAKARRERGLLDAITVSGIKECPACYDEIWRMWAEYCQHVRPFEAEDERLSFEQFAGVRP